MYNKEDSQRLTPASISLLHLPSRWAALYKLGTPNNGFLRVTKKTVTNHSAGHSRLGTEDTTCCDFALTVMRTLRPESAPGTSQVEGRKAARQTTKISFDGGGGVPGYFPGGAVVKTLPSNAESAGSTPGWGASIPHASLPKNQNIKNNRSNIVTKSLKTLKMVHIKKSLKKDLKGVL